MRNSIPALIWILSMGLGCSSEPMVSATVRDIWGHLIPGAAIRVGNSQVVTGEDGRVDIPAWTGAMEVHIGRDGYIPTSTSHSVPEGEDVVIPVLDVSLYRKPDPRDEIFLVGHRDYERVDSRSIERKVVSKSVGQEFIGIRMPSTDTAPKVPHMRDVELVWASKNSSGLVQQQKPRVRLLEWMAETECVGTHGTQICEVGLHVPVKGDSLGSLDLLGNERDFYFHVYRIPGPVEKGNYVLYFDEVLESTGSDFTDLSEELRQAYPFMVR
jgi:hypothetical protein